MKERVCNICNWPIEPHQKFITIGNGYIVESPNEEFPYQRYDAYQHRNPADHKPTKEI